MYLIAAFWFTRRLIQNEECANQGSVNKHLNIGIYLPQHVQTYLRPQCDAIHSTVLRTLVAEIHPQSKYVLALLGMLMFNTLLKLEMIVKNVFIVAIQVNL